MNEYTPTEKKIAKRLKKLAEEAGHKLWSHTQCLRLVRHYASARRPNTSTEEFAAFIFDKENPG